MSVWTWVLNYRTQAILEQDKAKWNLFQLAALDALDEKKTNPEQAIAMLEQARSMAEEMNESWWVLFCDHWIIQTRLHSQRDYRTAQKLAIQAAVETRKPEYANFPQRICLHEDLLATYIHTDPQGYTPMIHKAFDYMKQEITPSVECYLCFHGLQISFALRQENWLLAQQHANRLLAICETNPSAGPYHACSAYADLCEINYRLGHLDQIPPLTTIGIEQARKLDRDELLLLFNLWQAVADRHAGNETSATNHYTQAQHQQERLTGMLPSGSYYFAAQAYHELGQEWAAALTLRQQQYAEIKGKGQTIVEYKCARAQYHLLQKLGQPTTDILTEIQTIANRFKDPTPYLAFLNEN
ncbi:MAG TPA: hypothetical protein VLL52_23385 [Anaerolineae bacterium]|nr:hypothetical protein [Anaerolineae bacterium]